MDKESIRKNINNEKITQEQFYDMLISRKVSWQEIIYDLVSSEQLDPWDIDITKLALKYIERIRELEESNFFVSSKVLLVASILLRMKSELLLNNYIKTLDEILFGKKEESIEKEEKIEFEEELPELIPKTPLPRLKRVTLEELMKALDSAIKTEHRRIKRELSFVRVKHGISTVLPRVRINIKEKIIEIYKKVKKFFSANEDKRLTFSYLCGDDSKKEEKIATFIPLLHLDNQEKITLEQQQHFGEIFIWLKNNTSDYNFSMSN